MSTTRGIYARMLLSKVSAPNTLHNLRALMTQMQCEGGEARNNPFNVTLKTTNSWDYNWNNGFPVQSYASLDEGINATAQILNQQNFNGVLHALKSNFPARKTIKIIGRSPWGTSQTLMTKVLAWISAVPSVLNSLEQKTVAGAS